MKSRKSLPLLLTAALLMTTLLSAVWLPLSAEDNSTRIPADAPAIRADVGDVIDLSSYTVELPDGSVVSGKDLTWYDKGAEKTVKSATPVIYTGQDRGSHCVFGAAGGWDGRSRVGAHLARSAGGDDGAL